MLFFFNLYNQLLDLAAFKLLYKVEPCCQLDDFIQVAYTLEYITGACQGQKQKKIEQYQSCK